MNTAVRRVSRLLLTWKVLGEGIDKGPDNLYVSLNCPQHTALTIKLAPRPMPQRLP